MQQNPTGTSTSNDEQVRKEQRSISFTELTGPSSSRCTKIYRRTSEGIQKDSAPQFSSGHAKTVTIKSVQELPDILDQLSRNQCITTGVFDQPQCTVVSQKNLTDDLHAQGYRSRSKSHVFQPNHGLICFDYDPSPDMPAALVCNSVKEVMDKITHAIPELTSVGYVGSTSCSAGLYNTETEEDYLGGGFHIYIVANGTDLEIFKKSLEIKLWNAGLGYIGFARSGAMLNRTLIDLAVLSPERLIYEASPVLGKGIGQRRREWTRQEGSAIDY